LTFFLNIAGQVSQVFYWTWSFFTFVTKDRY